MRALSLQARVVRTWGVSGTLGYLLPHTRVWQVGLLLSRVVRLQVSRIWVRQPLCWGWGGLLIWGFRLGWGSCFLWSIHHIWGAWLSRGAWFLAGGLLSSPRRLLAAGLVVLASAPRHQTAQAQGQLVLDSLLLCFRLWWSRRRRWWWWWRGLWARGCLFSLLASWWVLRGLGSSAWRLLGIARLLTSQHLAHHPPHHIGHPVPGQTLGLFIWAFG